MFETIDRSPRAVLVAPTSARRNALPGAADPSFAAVMTRLRALNLGDRAEKSADAATAPGAALRACLLDLHRIHAGCEQEVGRRRQLELEAFDARVSRLFAAQRSASRR